MTAKPFVNVLNQTQMEEAFSSSSSWLAEEKGWARNVFVSVVAAERRSLLPLRLEVIVAQPSQLVPHS